ncbi:MAG TPA: transketolase [Acidimicrobiales bacterium]|nr:transketolase [Acidimicrobiales bacterium]
MIDGTAAALPVGRIGPSEGRSVRVQRLADAARAIRRRDLEMVSTAGLGHIGGDLSAADIVTVLVLGVLNVDPTRPATPDRDRFVMSKGHCSGLLYTALAARGFFDQSLLNSYMMPLSPLNGHPDINKVPGVEANTGPLGHGLPIAVGMAIAAQLRRSQSRTFCLMGDGELQEGSNWEAFLAAGHRGLDRLAVVVDRNGLQQGGGTEETSRLEPLSDKARSFGWAVAEVDGHDHGALLDLFENLPVAAGKPSFIIARTHKGHPVSFMRDRVEWHHRPPSNTELVAALEELR